MKLCFLWSSVAVTAPLSSLNRCVVMEAVRRRLSSRPVISLTPQLGGQPRCAFVTILPSCTEVRLLASVNSGFSDIFIQLLFRCTHERTKADGRHRDVSLLSNECDCLVSFQYGRGHERLTQPGRLGLEAGQNARRAWVAAACTSALARCVKI